MNISGNTILITGGGSGIGHALAEAFHAKGNQVIVAGRRPGALDETTAANPGMRSAVLDIEDRDAIPAFAARIAAEFPTLNVLVNNAGIMRRETLTASPVDLATAEATVATNLLGPIRLTAAFLPHLRRQPGATVLMVSSGLAFVPIAITPTYCATKAAILFLFAVSAVAASRQQRRGARTCAALCSDRTDGPGPEDRPSCAAAQRLHRRDDEHS